MAPPSPHDAENTPEARALAAARDGDLTTATRLLKEALDGNPNNPELLNALGEAMISAGNMDAAVRLFAATISVEPRAVSAYRNLAGALTATGRYEEAIAVARQGLDVAPDFAGLWRVLGAALRGDGCLEKALECFERAMDLGSEDSQLLFQTGLIQKSLGRVDVARHQFREALSADPGNVFFRAALDTVSAALESPHPKEKRRVALHMNQPFHYGILKPLFGLFSQRVMAIITGDASELVEFDPQVVLTCDAQIDNLRKVLPSALFVDVRHGIIGKNRFGLAARMADYVCATSEANRDALIQAGVNPERLWLIGLVQMDPLFRNEQTPPPFPVSEGDAVVLYAPTYNPLLSSVPMLGGRLVELIRGERKDVTIVIKPHPHTCMQQPEWMNGWRDLAAQDAGVHLVDDPAADVAPYLKAADVLISDASSVTYQFLALDRPIILIANPDRFRDSKHFNPEGMEWQWRDMGEDLDDIEQLPAAIERALTDPRLGAPSRAQYRKRLFGDLTDGRAAERIVAHVSRLLE